MKSQWRTGVFVLSAACYHQPSPPSLCPSFPPLIRLPFPPAGAEDGWREGGREEGENGCMCGGVGR